MKYASHDHRLSRWLAQPYKGILLAGLKAHRKTHHLQTRPTATNVATIFSLPCVKGGGTARRDGGIVLFHFSTSTIPQSPSVTAPLAPGNLPLRRDCSTAKASLEPPAQRVVFVIQKERTSITLVRSCLTRIQCYSLLYRDFRSLRDVFQQAASCHRVARE